MAARAGSPFAPTLCGPPPDEILIAILAGLWAAKDGAPADWAPGLSPDIWVPTKIEGPTPAGRVSIFGRSRFLIFWFGIFHAGRMEDLPSPKLFRRGECRRWS